MDSDLRPIGDMARENGLKIDTMRKRCQREKFTSAVKLANRWFISQEEFGIYLEERKERQQHDDERISIE